MRRFSARLLLLLFLLCSEVGSVANVHRPRVLRSGEDGAANALVAALREDFPVSLRELASALRGPVKLYVSRRRNMVKGITAQPFGTLLRFEDVLDILDAAEEKGRCRHLLCRRFVYPRTSAMNVPSLERGLELLQSSEYIGRKGRLRPTFRVSWQHLRWGMHYDSHCNTVVQLKGTKTWRFLPPDNTVAKETLESDRSSPGYRHGIVDLFEDDDVWAHETAESRAIEFEIHEGDMLLVPRGWAHAVQSRGNFSASVNWFYECDTVEEYEDKIPDEL
jgi:hypothetical protein